MSVTIFLFPLTSNYLQPHPLSSPSPHLGALFALDTQPHSQSLVLSLVCLTFISSNFDMFLSHHPLPSCHSSKYLIYLVYKIVFLCLYDFKLVLAAFLSCTLAQFFSLGTQWLKLTCKFQHLTLILQYNSLL